MHTILPTDIIRVDFPKLCEESVLDEGVLDEDTAADVFSPKDAVIRREISVSCLWDLDASPDTGFYF